MSLFVSGLKWSWRVLFIRPFVASHDSLIEYRSVLIFWNGHVDWLASTYHWYSIATSPLSISIVGNWYWRVLNVAVSTSRCFSRKSGAPTLIARLMACLISVNGLNRRYRSYDW